MTFEGGVTCIQKLILAGCCALGFVSFAGTAVAGEPASFGVSAHTMVGAGEGTRDTECPAKTRLVVSAGGGVVCELTDCAVGEVDIPPGCAPEPNRLRREACTGVGEECVPCPSVLYPVGYEPYPPDSPCLTGFPFACISESQACYTCPVGSFTLGRMGEPFRCETLRERAPTDEYMPPAVPVRLSLKAKRKVLRAGSKHRVALVVKVSAGEPVPLTVRLRSNRPGVKVRSKITFGLTSSPLVRREIVIRTNRKVRKGKVRVVAWSHSSSGRLSAVATFRLKSRGGGSKRSLR